MNILTVEGEISQINNEIQRLKREIESRKTNGK
jgi:hypothetical protein